jgi:hypothetical protein
MNKENAHLYLPLIQALAEGKMIQIWMNAGWMDVAYVVDIRWDLPPESYRVKPEPREWVLHRPPGCIDLIAYSSPVPAYGGGIRVREILD